MLTDARKHGGETIDADLCIIGGGAAGITIASKFAGSKVRVVLLESGGPSIDRDTEQLNANAAVSGLKYPLAASRLRFFGGTTNHWSGHCYRFLERDFAPRDGIPNTGWPIALKDIAGYLPEASKLALFRSTPAEWSPDHWRKRLNTKAWPLDPAKYVTRLTFVSPPNPATGTRTFATYGPQFQNAPNITVLQYANVAELVGGNDAASITHAQVRTLSGNEFKVSAKTFVLAAGGIENARIMLASRKPFANGLGNQTDQVGRYFTDHVVIYQKFLRNPSIQLDRLMAFQDYPGNTRTVGHFIMTDELLRSEGIDDCFLRITPVSESLSTGADAARRVQDKLAAGDIGKIKGSDLSTALSRPGEVGSWALDRAYCKAEPIDYSVALRLEPRPVADSRVTLTDRKDALGMPIMNLNWALADEGKHSIRRALELFAQEAGRLNLGRLKLTFDPSAPWPEFPELDIGYHHTGTTRMSSDPKHGVVDGNCRVHGISNMFVAGSSVFPTSGSGSPTMMLTALSLRLAEHLKAEQFA